MKMQKFRSHARTLEALESSTLVARAAIVALMATLGATQANAQANAEGWWNGIKVIATHAAAGSWNFTDLSSGNQASAPPASGTMFGYVFDATSTPGTQYVNYRGDNGHVYEASWDGGWKKYSDLTFEAGYAISIWGRALAPLTAGDPAGYEFKANQSRHVNYRGYDNHIYELYWKNGVWQWYDLTRITGAPLAAGDPKGYTVEAQGTMHVNYRSQSGAIIELYWNKGWHWYDLTHDSTVPTLAEGDPAGYVFTNNSQHIVYRGQNGHIYELWWNNGWGWTDLTFNSKAPTLAAGDPKGYVFTAEGTQHVNYRGTDRHIYELYWANGDWQYSDLTKSSGNAPLAVGDPVGYVFVAQNTQHVIYQCSDLGEICELYWVKDNFAGFGSGSWHFNERLNGSGSATSAPTGSGLTAYMFNGEGTQHIIYHGTFGNRDIYDLYWTAPLASSTHFHADITFPDPITVGGYSDLVLNQNGFVQASGHLQDGGIPDYQAAAVWFVVDGTGHGYAFDANGNMQGTDYYLLLQKPNPNWDWYKTGWSSDIQARWEQFRGATAYLVTSVSSDAWTLDQFIFSLVAAAFTSVIF
jgi:hypothetical protein